MLSFRGGTASERLVRAGVLVAALSVLWLLARTPPVTRALSRAIRWALARRGFAARDFATVLDLAGDYAVAELQVREGDWVAGCSLRELRLRDEGVIVIGVHRGGSYHGAPQPETVVLPQDTLVLYGREKRIAELDRRQHGPAGDAAHDHAHAEEVDVEHGDEARPESSPPAR